QVQAPAWCPWKSRNERAAKAIQALSMQMKKAGEFPPEALLDTPKAGKLRARLANEAYAAGRRAEGFTPKPVEHFIPNAADAYELGHAENIGILYHSAPDVQR